MKIIYNKHYNYKLGLLKYLHPFEGMKFKSIHDGLKHRNDIEFITPNAPVEMEVIDSFLSSMMRKKVRDEVFIFRAMEVPRIPLIPFSYLDRKILTPMRWGVAGTLLAAESALQDGGLYWNLSGGYHHAMPQNMEGFCIYNDVGICYQQLLSDGRLTPEDKVLIIDTDAHHGNGNAYTFLENSNVTILDIYNAGIYPRSDFSRQRVDIPVPLIPGTEGDTYLESFKEALEKLSDDYRLAFVVAGTDVVSTDKLGGLNLSIEDVAEREKLTVQTLQARSIPTVILGGGGYSKDSAKCVISAIQACVELG